MIAAETATKKTHPRQSFLIVAAADFCKVAPSPVVLVLAVHCVVSVQLIICVEDPLQ
jgi:hypothetical protein